MKAIIPPTIPPISHLTDYQLLVSCAEPTGGHLHGRGYIWVYIRAIHPTPPPCTNSNSPQRSGESPSAGADYTTYIIIVIHQTKSLYAYGWGLKQEAVTAITASDRAHGSLIHSLAAGLVSGKFREKEIEPHLICPFRQPPY